jgi:ribokinase
MAIVVAGSLNMDFVVTAARLPAPGETVLGGGFAMLPGGKGANQACAAGRLGAGLPVKMIGRVGYDLFADHLKASLAAAGVDVSAVHASRTQPTGVAFICVEAGGQNSIIVAPGANQELGDAGAMRQVFRGARIALFQLESPLDTVRAALTIARQEGLVTILDPAPAQPLDDAILSEVSILTPNESEALLLVGESPRRLTPEEAAGVAQALRAKGADRVIVKLGDAGCLLADEGRTRLVSGFAVEAVDATAAGDVFNGALAVALAEGRSLDEAAHFANAAAALSVTRRGAQSSVPSRAETDALLAGS